jgi:hypothetical protein
MMFDINVGFGESAVIGKSHHCHFPSASSVSDSDRGFEPVVKG